MSCGCYRSKEHSGNGCFMASTLCMHDLRKDYLFVLRCDEGGGKVSLQSC